MRKGIIIFISALIMIFASVSLFGQYGRGYGNGRNRGDYCGYNNNYNRGNNNGCYYYN
ncbi:hypothetical protein [Brachyspira hyodysenteriae]|uniref:Uncharacterized protein n=1 Tax=Brachyspira hyodysenteriae (strain ATCC 49526 / WA1) TaxID=565034 RepID=A0A3B6VH00_BRAHW|nr:hypothetical protein [Brachyspira hyodysenteriae]ACN83758.1 hypothetical protein BHWA1_01279 [Brachyspira hyodysenteriae WA1]